MKLHNIDYVNLDDEEFDSLFIPRKEHRVKRMKNPQTRIKSERANKTSRTED